MSKELLKLKSTGDGLHIADSILWLDSQLSGDLSFLSSAAALSQSKVPQVIATEETVKILEACRKKPHALVCQYNNPFTIGRMKIELLPSGSILGGASLFIETDKGRSLYAPCLQPNSIATVRKMQIKKAGVLIMGANHPDPAQSMPSRRKERERLITTVREHLAEGRSPVILCNPIATAQEITKLLCDANIDVAVHSNIFRINRVYESFGSALGKFTLLDKKPHGPRVLLLPKSRKTNSMPPVKNFSGPFLTVEETLPQFRRDTTDAFVTKIEDTFYLSSYGDGPELSAIIQLVAPKELYFFGPYAKRYVQEMKDAAPKVRPLYVNDQPTLF